MHVRRSSRVVAIAIISALAATPLDLHAQFPSEVQAGTRVRAWVPEEHRQQDASVRGQRLRGTVESIAGDTLRISIPGTTSAVAVPRSSLARLDVSRGEPSRVRSALSHMVDHALLGAAIGLLVTNSPGRSSSPDTRDYLEALGIGAAWGAGSGVAYGLTFPSEQWRRIPLPR